MPRASIWRTNDVGSPIDKIERTTVPRSREVPGGRRPGRSASQSHDGIQRPALQKLQWRLLLGKSIGRREIERVPAVESARPVLQVFVVRVVRHGCDAKVAGSIVQRVTPGVRNVVRQPVVRPSSQSYLHAVVVGLVNVREDRVDLLPWDTGVAASA